MRFQGSRQALHYIGTDRPLVRLATRAHGLAVNLAAADAGARHLVIIVINGFPVLRFDALAQADLDPRPVFAKNRQPLRSRGVGKAAPIFADVDAAASEPDDDAIVGAVTRAIAFHVR